MAKIITELSGGGGSGIHNDLAGLNEGDYLHLTQAEKDNLLTGEGFVPYVGATTNVDLGEYQIKAEQLELDQTPTGAFSTAKIRWNDTAGTAEIRLKGNNVTLQLGQELVKRVVNKTATNITLLESNYQVVKIIGAIGQRLSVDLAQANSEINSATTLGLVTENISNNQEGFVTFSGEINLINTTGSLQGETWVDGDVLYLSPMVAGQLTKVVPIAPNHTVRVGYVQHSHITQGKLHVDIDRGYSIDNLHNVKITGTTDNKIIGSTTEGLWENKTVDDILGYTPENITNKVSTISGISETEYPNEKAVVDYVDSKLPSDYATVVYVDTNDPNTATIFDDVNPPVTNDPLLEDDVDNLYIGADSSTWVFNGTTYTTEIVPDNSNFFLNGVSVDAGNNKTGAIGRLGSITSQEAVSDTSNNSGSTLGQRGLSFFKWLSGVATFGRIKWDNIGANVTFQLPNTADNSTETFAMVSDVDGKQNQLTAGANITIDVTDPLAPVISSTGGGTPSLQDVTTIGSTTTVPIVVTNYEENAITGISAEAFGVLGQSTSGIGVLGQSTSGIGVLGQSTNSVAGRFSIPSGNTSNIAEFLKNNVIQASVSHLGDFTANSLIKSGATSDDVLLGDGSTTSLAGIGGGTLDTVPTDGSTNGVESNGVFDALATKQATLVSATNIKTINGSSILGSGDLVVGSAGSTDLGYTASPTDGTVTSSTGTDATVPLADGTNAGLLKPADFTQLSTLVSDLSAKAPLSSPALTGTPTAPTATVGTNTTQLATTAFVLANTSPNTTYSEVPTGTINGVNTTFILANTPSNAAAVIAIINGVTQYNGIDFTVSGSTITFTTAPTTGSTVYVYYNVSSGSSGGSGSTNLAYTPSPTNGIVTSDTGADATLPLADNTNAGLLKPADFTQLSGLVSALALKAPLASPTFTGTVSGITKTMVGLGNVDNTSDVNKPISTATQTALNGKQNTITLTTTGTSGASTLVGSTLNIPQYVGSGGSGTVTSVAVTTANGISGTVSNPNTTPAITLSMQDATTSQSGRLTSTDWNTFNNKQSTLVSGTNIKTVNGNSLLGSGNLVISGSGTVTSLSATDSTGIDFTITNPTTTPNISLSLTKDAVGLSNVDNTSDINKPVSTAQQTALNLKQNNITLTTTGTSGAATLTGATLNIPNYATGGGGISGSGTINYLSKWTSTTGLSNSQIVDNGTNVLVGTSTDNGGGKLQVNGGIRVISTGGVNTLTSRITISNISSTKSWALSSGIPAVSENGFAIINATDSLTALYVSENGSIGIGNSTPSEKLHITGNVIATGYKIPSGTSSQFLMADGSVTTGGGSGTVTSLSATDSTGIDFTITNATTTPNISLALTSAAVGLSNVNNTSDVSKPVSTAQQTALNLKAPLASPALTGVPTAPTATVGTNTTQLATTAFVIANSVARPYKVYTALLTQTSTNAPTAIVLENTLGGNIVWTRTAIGAYYGTLTGFFTDIDKVFCVIGNGNTMGSYGDNINLFWQRHDNDAIHITTVKTNNNQDGVLVRSPIEIRVYP